ncbi:selenoprotein W-related protein [Tumebacillus permanentifrigoris]|uniref:Selenoprotein W-related protein n=1 Tax=Tumebacillus permanentifrigoris TaxID=378543 RepID=A0A316D6B5_9BACL|nr:selenoprotein W-related protein [Tumebacillus permanentifrigoris]
MPRAVSLTDELLKFFGTKIGSFTLIPSKGGVYEITFNGELIYSKKALGRFPEDDEVLEILRQKIFG